ncbi:gustatory receptor for sugar taste 43a-like [Copidosoma floridanum]|uniref:gustatory receptor for sugar taste 43a-like n=1 Tax=Copidosoma floridanum TaxID=29053 RepID=UPI0006C9B79F|nr:gustatory receptor for sugar taste 43a-like [Copidosoma floridanum]
MEVWSDEPKKNKTTTTRPRNDRLEAESKVGPNSEKIKSDVFHTLAPIYHMSKIFGLLPVKFTKDSGGRYRGRLQGSQIIYGIVVLLGYMGAQCYGLYRDLRNGWQNSTRLSSETAITVTCSDVLAVISVVTSAIIGSSFRWRHLQAALNMIVDVDEKLGIMTSKNLRRGSIIVISCTFVYLVTISLLDYISWSYSFDKKNVQVYDDKGPINYSPIYFMYIVIMTFEMQYALVLFNVGERFLKLNKTIENLTKTNLIIEYFRKDMGLTAPSDPRKNLFQAISFVSSDIGHSRLRRTNKVSDFIVSSEGNGGTSEAIDQLITLHGTLCDCIIRINKAYGGTILIGTISCLIHLIITPYFLYNEIYLDNSSNWYVLALQVFWIIFHVYRLLLFVQPCYMVSVKAKITGALVSQALAQNWDPKAKKQLEIFSLQLLHRPVEFTACGLFFLDRGLVTSIVGAVTTYLVILVQFQNADDTKGTKHLLQNATELLKNASSFKNISVFKNTS